MDSLIDLTMKKFGWKKMNTEIEERINVKSNESIYTCLLYTSDAADEQRGVDLCESSINKKKKQNIRGV